MGTLLFGVAVLRLIGMATNTTDAQAGLWLAEMEEMRRMAAEIARRSAVLARRTTDLVGDAASGELESSADSAELWATSAEGPRAARLLGRSFETTRNCLNEAVWILDNARTVLREERPAMLGNPPAWA